ncbi:hypothetical protein B0H66DRAFT_317823 [Apodospora peruviana]|uniref:Uncharacterized protein n=1 Tax=Apodospora peruviana TaxID=516989 RepID=A0AAE0HXF8_9PEZI|nr:hypothetical protein B0H66DRAFT_317823 [Apodospora peruviana]
MATDTASTVDSAVPSPPTTISLRIPSKYLSSSATNNSSFTPPPLDWLYRTWSVTHSTLSMWRSNRNVRITYKPLPPTSSSSNQKARIDDLVEYESLSGKGGVKSVAGIDTISTAGDSSAWDWRGKGLLFLITSHWEILGWGERRLRNGEEVERWMVTWFAATTFTKEGVDIYCDRKEGPTPETADAIIASLQKLDAKPLAEMCATHMREVAISEPNFGIGWFENSQK